VNLSNKTEGIVFINLPKDLEQTIGDFKVDPTIPIPLQLPENHKEMEANDVTVERIIAGMLKIIAWVPDHENFEYFRQFVIASQPESIEQLNLAAIAKEKKDDYIFSEELFLCVNHLAPQPASFINLATHYAKRATLTEDSEGKDARYDLFQQKTLDVLNEGLKSNPDNPDLLCEIGYFHIYQNNIDSARDYLEKYMENALEDDKRKEQVGHVLKDINNKMTNDTALLQAYDEIQLCNEDKALELLDIYLQKNPDVWNAYFFKGWALRRQFNYKSAKECFLECIKLGESNSEVYNELSICALEEGHKELAIFYLDSALDLEPQNLKLLTNLAYLKIEDKDFDKARQLLENARAIDIKDPLVEHLSKIYCTATGETLADKPVIEEVVEDIQAYEEISGQSHHAHKEVNKEDEVIDLGDDT
jgi:tetratricopeptide (TPR) repeat protein